MKNLFILGAIAVSLVACSSEGTTSTEQTDSLTVTAPVPTDTTFGVSDADTTGTVINDSIPMQ